MTTGTLLHPCDVRRPCADAELRPKPIKNHQKRTSLPPQAREWRQAMAAARGNEYLDADFPDLTRIESVTVVPIG